MKQKKNLRLFQILLFVVLSVIMIIGCGQPNSSNSGNGSGSGNGGAGSGSGTPAEVGPTIKFFVDGGGGSKY